MATLNKSEYVLDQLVCFLSNPLFQIPVLSFMETKCLIFNPSIEDTPSYHEIQEEYSKLVDLLLEGFRTDTGLSHEQIIEAMKTIISKPELRDIFQVLYDQVAATLDYPLFVHIMTQKNMDLQQQALLLITQMLGGNLPASLTKDSSASVGVSWGGGHSSDEDQILLAALATSKEEYERECEQTDDEQEELKLIIELSQATNIMLHHPARKEEEKLQDSFQKSLSLRDGSGERPKPSLPKPSSVPPPAIYTPKKQSATITDTKPKPKASSATDSKATVSSATDSKATASSATDSKATVSSISSADAAAAWMKSAETEVNSSEAHLKAVQAAAASIAGVSEEEFKKRAEFLRQQRDKLMEMKRKERVKKLLSAEQSQPQRPASARAARAALRQAQEPAKPSAEEEAKLALRNTIARNLKAELLNKK